MKGFIFPCFSSAIYSSFYINLVNSQLLASMYKIHLQSKTFSFLTVDVKNMFVLKWLSH